MLNHQFWWLNHVKPLSSALLRWESFSRQASEANSICSPNVQAAGAAPFISLFYGGFDDKISMSCMYTVYTATIYIFINNYTYYHTYVYIYDAIQRWLWNHPRLVDAWGFSNEHLSISGAGESKSGRGESWWSGMEMRATHGLNWMVEPCWTNRNSGYPRISQDTRIYHSYYPLVN